MRVQCVASCSIIRVSLWSKNGTKGGSNSSYETMAGWEIRCCFNQGHTIRVEGASSVNRIIAVDWGARCRTRRSSTDRRSQENWGPSGPLDPLGPLLPQVRIHHSCTSPGSFPSTISREEHDLLYPQTIDFPGKFPCTVLRRPPCRSGCLSHSTRILPGQAGSRRSSG